MRALEDYLFKGLVFICGAERGRGAIEDDTDERGEAALAFAYTLRVWLFMLGMGLVGLGML